MPDLPVDNKQPLLPLAWQGFCFISINNFMRNCIYFTVLNGNGCDLFFQCE